jgi:transposase-like protein
MGKKLINKHHTYSYELKKKAVELYHKGYSRGEIADRFYIKNVRLVNAWVRKLKKTLACNQRLIDFIRLNLPSQT